VEPIEDLVAKGGELAGVLRAAPVLHSVLST
jgi:hypothetical protein